MMIVIDMRFDNFMALIAHHLVEVVLIEESAFAIPA